MTHDKFGGWGYTTSTESAGLWSELSYLPESQQQEIRPKLEAATQELIRKGVESLSTPNRDGNNYGVELERILKLYGNLSPESQAAVRDPLRGYLAPRINEVASALGAELGKNSVGILQDQYGPEFATQMGARIGAVTDPETAARAEKIIHSTAAQQSILLATSKLQDGVNVAGYSGRTLADHIQRFDARESLYAPIYDIEPLMKAAVTFGERAGIKDLVKQKIAAVNGLDTGTATRFRNFFYGITNDQVRETVGSEREFISAALTFTKGRDSLSDASLIVMHSILSFDPCRDVAPAVISDTSGIDHVRGV